MPASLQELFDSAAQRVLVDPVGSLQKLRPLQRALTAFEAYDSRMEDLGRKLPATLVISSREFAAALRPHSKSKWGIHWGFGGKPRPIPVRGLAQTHLQNWLVERSKLDGALLLRFAQRTLAILTPWQVISYEALRRAAELSPPTKSLEEARRDWNARIERNRPERHGTPAEFAAQPASSACPLVPSHPTRKDPGVVPGWGDSVGAAREVL